MTRNNVSDPNLNPNPNTNPKHLASRHNVLVGPMSWFALTQMSVRPMRYFVGPIVYYL